MSQPQSEQKHDLAGSEVKSKKIANLSMGIFFLISSLSLIIVMLMFIFVWQPIWTEGFKDFHTISNAIDKLNKTARPASATIPLMLEEMTRMNTSMNDMEMIMKNMHGSMENLEKMTPNINRMTVSIEQMTVVMSTQMTRMAYLMDKIEDKLPSTNMLPFW